MIRTLKNLPWLCGILTLSALGQIPPGGVELARYQTLPLQFVQDEAMKGSWKVTRAELEEGIVGTWGVVEIQNVSTNAMEERRFYAEYYDVVGRLCFTLVFAGRATASSLNDDRPFAAAETRELLSLASDFVPASLPVVARIHLISDKALGKPERVVAGDRVIRSPATIEGNIAERQLRLNLDPSQRDSRALDIILAKVAIGSEGDLETLTIVNSLNSAVGSWFERAMRKNGTFRPATAGFVNIRAPGLVLVRIVSRLEGIPPSVLLARDAPWVKAYMSEERGRELPPITQLLFSPRDEIIPLGADAQERLNRRTPDPNLFEFISAGSFWCSNLFVWDLRSPSRPWTLTWRTH